jgi:hypothetical protein
MNHVEDTHVPKDKCWPRFWTDTPPRACPGVWCARPASPTNVGASYDAASRGPAMFYLYGTSAPGQTPETLNALREEITRIARDGVDAAELARAKAQLIRAIDAAVLSGRVTRSQVIKEIIKYAYASNTKQQTALLNHVPGYDMVNSYTDANDVYRNKLGITDAAQLQRAEYDLISYRSREILERGRTYGMPTFWKENSHAAA